MGTKILKTAKSGNKKNEKSTRSKKNQFSKETQVFLKFSKYLFGDLLTAFIEKRLKDLSKEKQYDLVWNILHYMYSDELLPTGDPDLDIRISEIIEKLTPFSVEIFQNLTVEMYGKFKRTAKEPQFAS